MGNQLKHGISMILLSYAEEANLRVLLPQIRTELERCKEPYEIIVVDAAVACDHSREVCEKNAVSYINQEEPRFGGAFRTGIRHAQYDKFFIMDSDGSHHPRYIPDIYHCFMEHKCDIAIGSRYTEGGENHDALLSRMMSLTLNTIYGVFLGVKAKDMSTDFRLYRTRRLKEVEPSLRCQDYDALQEVILKLKLRKQLERKRFTITETPIHFEKRLFGNSKRKLLRFILSYIKTLFYLSYVRLSFRWQHRQ